MRRSRFIVGWLLFSAVALVAAFLVLRPGSFERGAASTPVTPPPKAGPVGEAVLTVVTFNSRGKPVAQGSGFILTADGLAASNYHVFKGATAAAAQCCGGRTFEIDSVEGADLGNDLVLFQLHERGTAAKPERLPHLELGSSKTLSVGDKVIVIGSPQGLENTVSDGILSATREYQSVRYLQITAPISEGSSGGPVLDSNGKLVGIATFQVEKGQNLNFAIAVEQLRPLLDEHFGVSLGQFQEIVREATHKRVANAEGSAANQARSGSQGSREPLTGQFGGIVHNQTAELSAEFGIVVWERDGALSGCMVVAQPLFGSGPLKGYISDADVSFTASSAIGEISFVGKMRGNSISGTYVVEHHGLGDEHGTFTLKRTKSEGPPNSFDPKRCPTDAEVNQ